MSGITYITIPVELFADKSLCDTQRHILGLAISFDEKGVRLSNQQLAGLFNKNPKYIGDLIVDLARKDFIKIENGQSKYRVFYFQGKLEVKDGELPEKPGSRKNLLPEKSGLLPDISGSTSRKTWNINKLKKETKNISTQQQAIFEAARKIYPGTKRGFKTEFESFRRKHKDFKEVLPLLKPAIERQSKTVWLNKEKRFVPHFSTWLNQRRWELECPTAGAEQTAPFDFEAARQREAMLAASR
jgi:hypothetical protein